MKRKIKQTIISIILIIFICFTTIFSIAFIPRISSPKSHYAIYNYERQYINNISKKELKERIDKVYKLNYSLKEQSLTGKFGKATLILNVIYIDDKLDIEDYGRALAHELSHIKYFSCDERYTEFKTFKLLWNSEDVILQKIAINLANEVFFHMRKDSYDCCEHIKNYLEEINDWDKIKITHKSFKIN